MRRSRQGERERRSRRARSSDRRSGADPLDHDLRAAPERRRGLGLGDDLLRWRAGRCAFDRGLTTFEALTRCAAAAGGRAHVTVAAARGRRLRPTTRLTNRSTSDQRRVENRTRELFRRPPGNHVIGLLDYGRASTGNLPGEPVADLVDPRTSRLVITRVGGYAVPRSATRFVGGQVLAVRPSSVLDEHRP